MAVSQYEAECLARAKRVLASSGKHKSPHLDEDEIYLAHAVIHLLSVKELAEDKASMLSEALR